jgi:hypothetical protein
LRGVTLDIKGRRVKGEVTLETQESCSVSPCKADVSDKLQMPKAPVPDIRLIAVLVCVIRRQPSKLVPRRKGTACLFEYSGEPHSDLIRNSCKDVWARWRSLVNAKWIKHLRLATHPPRSCLPLPRRPTSSDYTSTGVTNRTAQGVCQGVSQGADKVGKPHTISFSKSLFSQFLLENTSTQLRRHLAEGWLATPEVWLLWLAHSIPGSLQSCIETWAVQEITDSPTLLALYIVAPWGGTLAGTPAGALASTLAHTLGCAVCNPGGGVE